jgi:hypothetical protein
VDGIGAVMGFLQNELLQLIDVRDADATIVPQHTLLVYGETRHFFSSHSMLDPFNALMTLVSFFNLVKKSGSDFKVC